MDYIDTINDYEIFEASKKECAASGYCYPTFAAFLKTDDGVEFGHEECSLESFDELANWCEKN